ncbi:MULTISPECIES: phosphotransferase [unclassified Pseudomonas]|uniref:phosphotransferase n=1 Tax=unclassified Pseudomonas TaxID=196821 RepID=UPI00119B898C|nr:MULTISPECIES: phosphotransferase [unclassified Pseudomonas]TWC17531.1 Ser/Thr protein kinase RdoA (MazF antagonist) [Pseudomonas sp. SJZ074]TWC19658.1 Ser/Thr protein kinase RdoA (MazF antagonist) [Pseudomonas sp. SJZ075]TWC35442.1 Ser/Thr protein kinase RdoA (MazF antagonist) [Pseudomonas sp. SJZ078]TWC35559.1 Ser/Thr protein kinase RdoA (MazF antagonist) [Pseudomonas sp. SJZ085]TWC56388.1 Ser/Thr protein kinase RdoA (MazF antagonist) [Pseudomonas sp. SJZ124]
MEENPPITAAALSTAVPSLAPDEVGALVRCLYGIDGRVKSLVGERDQNCRIETDDGRRYVVKISNPSEPVSVVDFQIAALEHIARVAPELVVPRVVRTLGGQARDAVMLTDGGWTTVRMLTYLDGVQIRDTVRTAAQRRAMGTLLARLNLALREFTHPSATHDLLWNVCAAHRLAARLSDIVDTPRRALAESFMTRFTEYVLPHLASVRSQVIHNDYHLYNVLVAPEDHERMVGIIDFGDMLHAPLVGEVATAAAFHMSGTADPFEGAAQFVGAYHAALPLSELEQEIVADLMATRHLITVLISEWRAKRYPENRAYIMRHNPAAWEALSRMADLSRAEARDRLLTEVRKGQADEKHH